MTNARPPLSSLEDFGVYTPTELQNLCMNTNHQQYLIDDYLPRQSLTLGVGASGLGKSPFFYQAALCVAAGVPFLGLPTTPGRVLYADNENSPAEVLRIVQSIAGHIGLAAIPSELLLYNKNNCSKDHSVTALVENVQPDVLVLDPIYA